MVMPTDPTPDPVEVAARAHWDHDRPDPCSRCWYDDATPGWKVQRRAEMQAALDAVGYAALVAERDRLTHALKLGWTWGQYRYAEDHNEWGAVAGDGTSTPWAALSDEGEVT